MAQENKNSTVFALVITCLVLGLFLAVGPLNLFPTGAIIVTLPEVPSEINVVSSSAFIDGEIELTGKEFLPIIEFQLVFENLGTGNDDASSLTCSFNTDYDDDCDFLSIDSLSFGPQFAHFGYGYSYTYAGVGGSFGYGFGYASGSSPDIAASIKLDPSLLPGEWLNDELTSVTFKVVGGSDGDTKTFSSSPRNFLVISSGQTSDPIDDSVTSEFSYGNGAITVSVPPGTCPDGSTISVEQITASSPAQGAFSVLGRTFEITSTCSTPFPLDAEVTVTIQLTEEDFELAGLDPDSDTFEARFYDPATGVWVTIGGTLDKDTLLFTFKTTHFTPFAILGGTPSSSGGGGGSSSGGGGGGGGGRISLPCRDECNPERATSYCKDGGLFSCMRKRYESGQVCYVWTQQHYCYFGCESPVGEYAYCAECMTDANCPATDSEWEWKCGADHRCIQTPVPAQPVTSGLLAPSEPERLLVQPVAPQPAKPWWKSPLAIFLAGAAILGAAVAAIIKRKKPAQ